MLRIGAVGKYVFLGGCYLLLNLYTLGLTVGNLTWISTPHDHDYYTSYTWNAINNSSRALSIATNAVTTMMIAYKLWYVAMNETHGPANHHEGIFQESPPAYIHPKDSRAEETNEPSADIDSSRRIRHCFPRNSGQLLWYQCAC